MGSPQAPQDHQKKTDPRGVQRIKIGGKSRLVRFDGNAIIEACDVSGKEDIEEVLNAAAALNPKMIRALVWAGILHEGDDVDLQEVGSWLGDGKGLTSFADALVPCVLAVTAAIGGDQEEINKAVKAAADPTRRGGTGKKQSKPRSQPESDTTSSGD